MITPYFELSQDDKFVVVRIRVPHVRASEMEFYIQDNIFKFYVQPYLLTLHFSQNVVENGEESASYDFDSGFVTVKVPKAVPGENFVNLEMLTDLLTAKKKERAERPLIEVVEDHPSQQEEQQGREMPSEEELILDVETHSSRLNEAVGSELTGQQRYGFGQKYSRVFADLHEDISEILDNPDPEHLTAEQIAEMKRAQEESSFDADHYLFDTFGNAEEIAPLVKWDAGYDRKVVFSEKENEFMLKLPKREYLPFAPSEMQEIICALIDILFAYAYDHRINMGEHSTESHWTMASVSSCMSWLARTSSIHDVLTSSYRRALIFPLYRNFELVQKVHEDVCRIVKNGPRSVLRALLECKYIFDRSESRFRMSTIYLTDYCVWVQTLQDEAFWTQLAETVRQTVVSKQDVDLSLDEYESIAQEDLAQHQEMLDEQD